MSHEDASEDEAMPQVVVMNVPEDPGPALRWTPSTVIIDLFNALGTVLEGIAGLFRDQARSLAARLSLREDLKDRQIQLELREQERRSMRLHTMEDIACLPESRD